MTHLSSIPVGRGHIIFVRNDDARDYYVLYYDGYGTQHVKYNIAGMESTENDKKPATAFILHRKSMQECFNILNLKLKRQDISKISKKIWKDLSKTDTQLIETIKESYRNALEEYRRTHFRIQSYEGPQGPSRVESQFPNYAEFDYHFYNPTEGELINDLFLENRNFV
ncbi:8581_t:CDS:2 [Diversispora eburnea]|uniref:8581_t:CDS:1 n=1 Tax=Diversispora eburnea TaxID=1213867 RepID=A0A9N8V2U1_9GLOM|nr:8581_t:CDS:2 [Diversispora eburnea]